MRVNIPGHVVVRFISALFAIFFLYFNLIIDEETSRLYCVQVSFSYARANKVDDKEGKCIRRVIVVIDSLHMAA